MFCIRKRKGGNGVIKAKKQYRSESLKSVKIYMLGVAKYINRNGAGHNWTLDSYYDKVKDTLIILWTGSGADSPSDAPSAFAGFAIVINTGAGMITSFIFGNAQQFNSDKKFYLQTFRYSDSYKSDWVAFTGV